MTKSRKRAASSGDPRPIVTYAHVPLDPLDDERGPRDLEPDVDILDAVEVPRVGQSDAPSHAKDGAPELRADPRADAFEPLADDDADPLAEPRRRRSFGGRVVVLAGIVALAAGAGVIAASLGVFGPPVQVAAPVASSDPTAEIIAIHKEIDALGDASSPAAQSKLAALTKRLAELEQSSGLVPNAPAEADAPKAVRQISLSPNGEAAPASPPVTLAPPEPRPRPVEKLASRPAAVAPLADEPPAAEPAIAAPVRPVAPQPKAFGKAAPVPVAPAGDDHFIESVEKALADSESRPEPLRPAPAMGRPAASGASPLPSAAAIAAPPSGATLPTADDSVDPYALPAPLANGDPVDLQPKLPPGVKLPPADIPNVPPPDQQY